MSEHEKSEGASARETLIAGLSGDLSEPSETTVIVHADMLKKAQAGFNERTQAYLIVISGPHVGRMYKVDQQELTMGRSPQVDIQLNDVGVSRRHARIVRRADNVFVQDMKSANGTYINGVQVTDDFQLEDGDKITLGGTTILKFTYHDQFDDTFQRDLIWAAQRDGLTGAYNKKHLLEQMRTEMSYALRHGTQLSLLMFDVDFFKKTNDTYGHLAGDFVLKRLAQLGMESIRDEDIFARYGGEEFAILCRGIDIQQCAKLGSRLRKLIERTKFKYNSETIPITISVGVSGIPGIKAEKPEDLILAADQALYAAKNTGRNRVMIKDS